MLKFYRDSYITYLFLSVLISQATYTVKVVFILVLTGARKICIESCICFAEIGSGRYYSKSQFECQWLQSQRFDKQASAIVARITHLVTTFRNFDFSSTLFAGIHFLQMTFHAKT